MSGILYVVGTPIGNLGDMSPRGLECLKNCDFIAAEDTRVTLKLLNKFEIKKTLISYHEHNKFTVGEQILTRLLNGENCALVTDAGMPAISDPGEELVALCHINSVKVQAVPGPSAFATALAISGLPSKRFAFEGFPPANKKERRKLFESLKSEERTLIFYEAPHKLGATLRDLADIFGEREIAIVREITKIHEEVIKTDTLTASEKYADNSLKGEIVLVIHGCEKSEKAQISLEQAIKYALDLVKSGESKTNAAKIVAKESGFKKGDIYIALT